MKVRTKNRLFFFWITAILLTMLCITAFVGRASLPVYAAETENTDLPIPYLEGYTFSGWYYDAEYSLPYDGEPITEDVTLYANFVINKYTVTLIVRGEVYQTFTVEHGTMLETILSLEEMKEFSRIYKNAAMTELADETIIKSNLTLYAATDDGDNKHDLAVIQIIVIVFIVLYSGGVTAFFLIRQRRKKRKQRKTEI